MCIPRGIETEIDALPGVIESAVIGLPHADFGEGVTAVVVVARDGAGLDEKAVLGALDGRLAKYKLPKLIFLDDLPRNTMGKVQENLLRQQFEGCTASRAERAAVILRCPASAGPRRCNAHVDGRPLL